MKRNLLTGTLALLLISAAVTSIGCGDASSDTGTVTQAPDAGNTTETAAVTENIYAHDLGSYDFGGETFTIYARQLLHLNSAMHVRRSTMPSTNVMSV